MKMHLVLFTAIGTLLPTMSWADSPTAYLDRSQLTGAGKQIRAYRVPTKDTAGKIRYYDLTFTIKVLDNGKIDTNATRTASGATPNIPVNQFIPGTYKDANGNPCTVTASILSGGRMEGAISCKDLMSGYSYRVFSASWISGAIAGHPFEMDLRAAEIDKIPGYRNFSWGKIGYSYPPYYWWNCMDTGEVVSATQVGRSIRLSGYDQSNIQKCGVTLVKK